MLDSTFPPRLVKRAQRKFHLHRFEQHCEENKQCLCGGLHVVVVVVLTGVLVVVVGGLVVLVVLLPVTVVVEPTMIVVVETVLVRHVARSAPLRTLADTTLPNTNRTFWMPPHRWQ